MTDADLITAIQGNAPALAQATAGNDAGCAATISATLPLVVAPMPASEVLIWGGGTGVLKAIVGGTTNSNAVVASLCIAVQAFANGGGGGVLDITNPVIAGTGQALDALTLAGILPANIDTTGTNPTPGSKAHLLAAGSVPSPPIDPGQVSHVWAQFRPGNIVGGS